MLIVRNREKLSPMESCRTRYAAGLCGVKAEAALGSLLVFPTRFSA
jgi:hypothetical protein